MQRSKENKGLALATKDFMQRGKEGKELTPDDQWGYFPHFVLFDPMKEFISKKFHAKR